MTGPPTTDRPVPAPTKLDAWPSRLDALPPGRYFTRVPVASLLSGLALSIGVHILRGASDGPTVGLLAGIHGDETPGVRSIREVLSEISVEGLAGSLVAIPVANPLAWQFQQRTTPERDVDHANLAREFGLGDTGLPNDTGSLTRRIAAVLEDTFYRAITHLIDFHCFGRDTSVRIALSRSGQEPSARRQSAEMTQAFGLGVLREVQGAQGTTSAYAAAQRIPTCVVEMGATNAHAQCDQTVAALGRDGALRVMQYLGMVDTAPPGPAQQLHVNHIESVYPASSGYYLPRFDLEDLFLPEYPNGIPVRGNQPLGQVFDTTTLQTTEVVRSPVDGWLIGVFRGGPYQVGGARLSIAVGELQ